MVLNPFPVMAEARTDGLLSQIEGILHEEELALEELEKLITEERRILVGPKPKAVLDILQSVEDIVGRVGHLEAARERLAARMAADADGTPGIVRESAMRAKDPSASERLVSIRRRMLGAIARIAQLNEANGDLLGSLTRVTGAAIVRFSQLQEAEGTSQVSALSEGGARRSSLAIDIRA